MNYCRNLSLVKLLATNFFIASFYLGAIVGCTKAAPKIQSLGKTVNSFDFSSQSQSLQTLDPNTNSFTISGSCSKDVETIQINHPTLKEWTEASNFVDSSNSDLNCSDGNFKIVISTVSGPFAFSRDHSYSSSLEIRMITKFKEIDIKRVELNYLVDQNQPAVRIVIVNNLSEVTEGISGTFQVKFVIDKSFSYHTKDIKGSLRIDGDVANTDYSVSNTSFTISAGLTESLPITITVLKDNLFELDENLLISIDTLNDAVKDKSYQASLLVHNIDSAPSISVPANLSIIEGDQSGNTLLDVNLSSAAGTPITFHAQTSDGNIDTSYYESINSDFTIPAGATKISIPIKAKDPDNTALSSKYFNLDISNISPSLITKGNLTTQINITDNDGPNIISLNTSLGKNSIMENDGTSITVLVSITKLPDPGKDVSVDLSFSGTASSVSDYSTSPVLNNNKVGIVFNSNDSLTKSLILNTKNDSTYESVKNIKVDLSNPSANANIFSGSQTGISISLLDDDISDFNITSIKGTLNTADVSISNGTPSSKILGNLSNITWDSISGASNIEVDVLQSGVTVSSCNKKNLSGTLTSISYIGTDCVLNSGQTYTAKVTASNSVNSITKTISFSTNTAPTAKTISKKLIMTGFDLTLSATDLATDSDNDTLSISSASRLAGSSTVNCAIDGSGKLKVSTSNSVNLGDTTCNAVVNDGNGGAVTVSVIVSEVPKNSWLGTTSSDFSDSNNWCTGLDSDRSSCTTNFSMNFKDTSLDLFINDLCSQLGNSNCNSPDLLPGIDSSNINSVSIKSLNISTLTLTLKDNTVLNTKSLVQNSGEISISSTNGNLNMTDSVDQKTNGKISGGNLLISSGNGSQIFEFNGDSNISNFTLNTAKTIKVNGTLSISNQLNLITGSIIDSSNINFKIYGDIILKKPKIEGGKITVLGTNNQTFSTQDASLVSAINNLTVQKSNGLLSFSLPNFYIDVYGSVELNCTINPCTNTNNDNDEASFKFVGTKDSYFNWSEKLNVLFLSKSKNIGTNKFPTLYLQSNITTTDIKQRLNSGFWNYGNSPFYTIQKDSSLLCHSGWEKVIFSSNDGTNTSPCF